MNLLWTPWGLIALAIVVVGIVLAIIHKDRPRGCASMLLIATGFGVLLTLTCDVRNQRIQTPSPTAGQDGNGQPSLDASSFPYPSLDSYRVEDIGEKVWITLVKSPPVDCRWAIYEEGATEGKPAHTGSILGFPKKETQYIIRLYFVSGNNSGLARKVTIPAKAPAP